jgi:nitrogen fixation NifU-like protein
LIDGELYSIYDPGYPILFLSLLSCDCLTLGCAISQASASMLTEMVINKSLNAVKDLSKDDIFENIGLTNLGQARVKCALLSLKVLKMGMVMYYADSDPNLAKDLQKRPSVY